MNNNNDTVEIIDHYENGKLVKRTIDGKEVGFISEDIIQIKKTMSQKEVNDAFGDWT